MSTTKVPPKGSRRSAGSGQRAGASTARVERHLGVAAADEVLDIDGMAVPLRPKPRRAAKLVLMVVVLMVVIVGFASLFIPPLRSWTTQQREYTETQKKLDAIRSANETLDAQIAALQTDAEVERIARERYNMVRKGDQVVAVLPAPAPNPLPAEWPYTVLQDIVTVRLQHPDAEPGATTAPTVASTAALVAGDPNAATSPTVVESPTTLP